MKMKKKKENLRVEKDRNKKGRGEGKRVVDKEGVPIPREGGANKELAI